MKLLAKGGVTSPKGFIAGATYSGMKTFGEDKFDLGILLSEASCVTAGTFTTNLIKSPSVVLSQEAVRMGSVRSVVVNSGIANACVGEQGMIDAQETVGIAASHLGISASEMAMCSTGIIGVELPMALIRNGIPRITLSDSIDSSEDFAKSILTTDRTWKSYAVQCECDGKVITIGGCIKGSGMIHPDMATMLAFLTTDASVENEYLWSVLREVVDDTFNMATIDGDGSTNDTVLLLSNGLAGNSPIDINSTGADQFKAALIALCDILCREMVRDAEGGSRIFSVKIEGAKTRTDARLIAKAVASSSLVKTAVHGSDPNWGRIMAAAGRSGGEIIESRISLSINDVAIMQDGKPIPFYKDSVVELMKGNEISFTINLNNGESGAVAWGCELTEEYVRFNSAYTS